MAIKRSVSIVALVGAALLFGVAEGYSQNPIKLINEDGGVTSRTIVDGSILEEDIGTDIITGQSITPNSVGTAELADNSVGLAELDPFAIDLLGAGGGNGNGTPQENADAVLSALVECSTLPSCKVFLEPGEYDFGQTTVVVPPVGLGSSRIEDVGIRREQSGRDERSQN